MSRTSSPASTGAAEAAANPPSSGGGLSHRQILTILSGLMMGMFLASLDQTIVSTAIRTIADDLNGLSQQAWATTAYLITSTVATPLYGKLSDIYGRKPFFLAAISIFVVGSALCTFSTSMMELAAFRAFQGLGAGGLMSLALAIIGDIVPPRERARYQGYILAVFATSTVLGPLVGGFLAGRDSILSIAGWRWVFLVNVPIGIIALFVVMKVLNVPHTRRNHRIDWWGALTIVIGVVPLLLVAEQGRDWGWTSTRSLVCYVVGVVGVVAWVFVERAMKDEALIPMRLFGNAVFSKVSLLSVLIGMAMFGAMMMIPQYLQIVKGETPTESGLSMLPLVMGMMAASITAGQLTSRTGRYKIFPAIGAPLMLVGMLLFHFRVQWDTPLWQTMCYMAVFGVGLGSVMPTLTLAIQNAADPKDIGVATSASTFFRQMGATAGTAIFLSVLFSNVSGKIQDAFRKIVPTHAFQSRLHDPNVAQDPHNAPVIQMLKGGGKGTSGVLSDSSFIQKLDPVFAQPFKQGFTSSMHVVFLIAAGIVVIAFFVVLWTREVPLRNISAMQARAEAEAGERAAAAGGGQREPDAAGSASGPGGDAAGSASGLGGDAADAPARQEGAGDAAPPVGSGPEPAGASALGPQEPAGASALGAPPAGAPAPGWPAIRGLVHGGDGTPVPSAVVTLIDTAGRQLGRTAAGPDGRYALPVPGRGGYVLIASAESRRPQAATVVADDTGLDVDLVLAGNAGLHGTVRDAVDGSALPGALVVAADGRGEVVASATADEHGAYRMTELAPGGYTLAVSGAGHRPAATPVEVAADAPSRQDVELEPGAGLSGTIRAAHSGRPVPDALVTLEDSAGRTVAATTTGEDGGYAFTDLDGGRYTVTAAGYAPVASPVRIEGTGPGGVDLELGHPDPIGSAEAPGRHRRDGNAPHAPRPDADGDAAGGGYEPGGGT